MADEADTSIEGAAAKIFGIFQAENASADEKLRDPETGKFVAKSPDPEPSDGEESQSGEGEPAETDDAAVEGESNLDTTAQNDEPEAKVANPLEHEDVKREIAKARAEGESVKTEYLNRLQTFNQQAQAAFAGEFGDIKTYADLQKVAQEDPARYNKFVISQQQLNAAQMEQQRVAGEMAQKWQTDQAQELVKLLPEITDPVKGPKIRDNVTSYAKSHGFGDEDLARISAREVAVLYDAARFKEAEKSAAQAKEKAVKAPPVQKPGARREVNPNARVQAAAQQQKKTGSIADTAALLRAARFA